MTFQYKMVQIPPGIIVDPGKAKGNEAAKYLEDFVNPIAAKGWEFYRIDTFEVHNKPGCLGALFGQRSDTITYYVVTFRKAIAT